MPELIIEPPPVVPEKIPPWKALSKKQTYLMNLCRAKTGSPKYIGVFGTRWSGKCVLPGTLVYTKDGPVPISMLGSAEAGSSSDATTQVVAMDVEKNHLTLSTTDKFFNSGVINGFSLKTYRGYELGCSEAHPIWCEINGNIGFCKASEINEALKLGVDVWVPMLRESPFWAESNKMMEFTHLGNRHSVELDADLAYVIGLLIGDGCYTNSVVDNFSMRFSSADQSIVDEMDSILKLKFPGFSISKHKKAYDYTLKSPIFRCFWSEFGLSRKYSYEKTVPDFLYGSPKAVIVGFLQGLYDTDGTVEKGKCVASFCSTSKPLASGVQNLLLALGVRSRIRTKKTTHRDAYILDAVLEDGFAERVGFRLERKRIKQFMVRQFRTNVCSYPPSIIGVLKRMNETRERRGVGVLNRFIHRVTIGGVLRGNLALSKRRLMPFLDILKCNNEPEIQQYIAGWSIWWDKLESATPIVDQMVDLHVPNHHNFISNGMISHNTWGALNCVADLLWTTVNARVLILVGTQGSGATSGVWNVMTEEVLPSWFEHEICKDGDGQPMKMGWSEKGEPRATIAKKMVCAVTNMHGGISRLELDSLDNEKEVEAKFKSRYYTAIYFSEAGEFKTALVLTTLFAALRGAGRKPDDFVLLADANPPDEGEDHFLFKYFYELRVCSDASPEEAAIQRCLHVTEWTMEDNPYLSDEEKLAKKGMYLHDPELYDRYIRGMWKRAIRDALFADIFRKALHVHDESMLLLPTEHCTELITSHDAGGVNPVSYILEQIIFSEPIKDLITGKTEYRQISFFQYIDELAFIGEEIQVSEFVGLELEKLDYWEKELGHPVQWWHYSDRSALDVKESIANRTVADEMFAVSGGRIKLIGVEKGAGSVGLRIRFWRRLLSENRVLMSGKCPKLMEMCQKIRKGRVEGTVATHSLHKHPFDAATYALVRLCWDEIQKMVTMVRRRERKLENGNSNGLVSVRL